MTLDTPSTSSASAPDPTAESQDVLMRILNMRNDALLRFYLGKTLGRLGKRLNKLDPLHADLSHELGITQQTLQNDIVLDVTRMMERHVESRSYPQNTFSYAIARMPDEPRAWKGLSHAVGMFKLRNPTVDVVKARLEALIARRRASTAYNTLKTIRDKILAHAERFDHTTLGRVTWINILSLMRFHDQMQKKLVLLFWNSNYSLEPWPKHSGQSLECVLRKGLAHYAS